MPLLLMRTLRNCLFAVVGALMPGPADTAQAPGSDAFGAQRKTILDEIAALTRETGRETGRASLSARVMEAMAKVPRHEFVPQAERRNAYANRPLPIGKGQTISQPFIVALMTDLMDIKPGDRVLEIGTGSGYQAAVLAELAERVYSVEIVESLGLEARDRLARLGYRNVATRVADGYRGWPEEAPFDAVMVTAAPRDVPQALIDQLKPGGRLVVPVGGESAGQSLLVIEKQPDGRIDRKSTRLNSSH